MPTRVFKFWGEPASAEDAALLRDQLNLAAQYERSLISIENACRDRIQQLHRNDSTFRESDDMLTCLFDVDAEQRDEAWEVEVERLREARSAAGKAYRQSDEFKQARSEIYIASREDRNNANVVFGHDRGTGPNLGFGTRNFVAEAKATAEKELEPWERLRPRREFDQGGIAASYNSPDAPTWLAACGTEAQKLVQVGQEKYSLTSTGKHERGEPTRFRVRGGSGAARIRRLTIQLSKGVFLNMHVLLSNEIPDTAVLNQVRVHQVRVGPRYRWSVQIVATLPELKVQRPSDASNGTCGVDLGFRRVEGGYRVAYAVSADGVHHHELVVPFHVTDRAIDRVGHDAKCTDLRSIRDKRFNELLDVLKETRANAPAWYLTETMQLHMWKSPGRVIRLLRKWQTRRWTGDNHAFEYLVAFRQKDEHLWAWEANNRQKMIRQIEGLYQRWAADLAKKYSIIKIEDLSISKASEDFRKRARKQHEADANKSTHTLMDRRKMLGLGRLQEILCDRSSSFASSLGKVDKNNTSKRCAHCGAIREIDDAQMQTCFACGVTEDRDVTAAKNIANAAVRKWLAGPLAEAKTAKPKKSRSTRRSKKVMTITETEAARAA